MSQVVSRKVNSVKSIVTSFVLNIVKILMQFLFRSVFIKFLSVEFLGVNSAITGLLNLLSVTELGISSAITFNLYKPIAENNIPKINAIMKLYRKFYTIIGFVVLGIGLLLMPFLKWLIADAGNINVDIYFVYVLALLGSVVSYFYSYKNVLFMAYQQQYKVNAINTITLFITMGIQISVIVLTRSFYSFLIAQCLVSIINMIATYLYATKVYPEINFNKEDKLDKETKDNIYKNVKGMVYHKLSYSVLQGSDSIIISSFIGATLLGVYSNYSLFITSIVSLFMLTVASLTGSIGNMIAEGDSKKSYSVYKLLKMGFFWVAGFCAISLFILLNPTIELWAKQGRWSTENIWTIDTFTIFVLVLNFYILTSRSITGSFREGIGDFYRDRYKSLFEALINVIVSLILVKPLGIAGVLIGTIVSCLCTSFWVDPYMVYKYHFKKPLWNHFKDFLFYTIIVLFAGVITYFVCGFISDGTIGLLIAKLSICLVVPNIIMFFCFMPTKEFRELYSIIKELKKRKSYKI
ncbi:MAG: hypothetical protein IJ310_05030 [Clostridia bacterium]|nr:hypothetical protein [Clostridia bacterium]